MHHRMGRASQHAANHRAAQCFAFLHAHPALSWALKSLYMQAISLHAWPAVIQKLNIFQVCSFPGLFPEFPRKLNWNKHQTRKMCLILHRRSCQHFPGLFPKFSLRTSLRCRAHPMSRRRPCMSCGHPQHPGTAVFQAPLMVSDRSPFGPMHTRYERAGASCHTTRQPGAKRSPHRGRVGWRNGDPCMRVWPPAPPRAPAQARARLARARARAPATLWTSCTGMRHTIMAFTTNE